MLRSLVLSALCAIAAPAGAADLEIIVDRHQDAVEVFVSLEATSIPAVFGTSSDFIAAPGEVVEYETLREGTWDQGDAMIAGSQLWVGGEATALEAMSLMVHPEDTPMPFKTVADAYLAMSVCNGFAPGTVPTVDILHVYAGYIAYPVAAGATLQLQLGNTDFLNVTLRDLREGGRGNAERLQVPPGGTITIARSVEAKWPLWTYFAAASLLAALVLVGCAVYARLSGDERVAA